MSLKSIALTTVLFDYPDYYEPTFYQKSLNNFNKEDIHIVRYSNLINAESYYDKLYYYKVVKFFEYVKDNLLGKYEYILFMDATDTAFIKSFDGVLEKFKNLNCNILFGAEKELWPPTSYVHLYNNKEKISEYCYLNSGTYFGYTDKIGPDLYNKTLSTDRANAVRDILQTQIPDAMYEAFGRGEDVPIFDNDIATGRLLSRTVQIYVETPR